MTVEFRPRTLLLNGSITSANLVIEMELTERHRELLRALSQAAAREEGLSIERVIGNAADVGDIEAVCKLINDEYLMHGIDGDCEPNAYGRELNELLNVVNRPRLIKRT